MGNFISTLSQISSSDFELAMLCFTITMSPYRKTAKTAKEIRHIIDQELTVIHIKVYNTVSSSLSL